MKDRFHRYDKEGGLILKFSRKATMEDFNSEMTLWKSELPKEIISLVDDGNKRKAITRLRECRGIGLLDCRNIIEEYEALCKAKNDFENGETVYVEY